MLSHTHTHTHTHLHTRTHTHTNTHTHTHTVSMRALKLVTTEYNIIYEQYHMIHPYYFPEGRNWLEVGVYSSKYLYPVTRFSNE